MNTNQSKHLWIAIVLSLLPIIYLAAIYTSLPAIVPTHFDMEGKPNDYSERSTLILLTLIFSVLSFGSFLLITNLPKIDPKKTAGQSPELFQKLGISISALLCFINFAITYAAKNNGENITWVLFPALGIFFAFLGKYMREIKPNYFAGFRTPWALENDDNWRETHQLAGNIWMGGGIAIAILTLALPINFRFIAFIITIVVMTIIPFIFSYLYFKKHS